MRSLIASLRSRWLSLVYISSACALTPSIGEAALLSVTPSAATVNAGDTVTIDVVIEDVADLGYIEFALDFDATLLSLDPAAIGVGSFLNDAGGHLTFPLFNPSFDPDTVYMRVLLGGASTPAGAPQTLLSLSFVALTPGASAITLVGPLLIDTNNRHNYMIGERYDTIAASVSNGSVDVLTPAAVVPEPSTIVLTMTGLGASWWKRRRARRGIA